LRQRVSLSGLVVALLAGWSLVALSVPDASARSTVAANWQMNDAARSTVMRDSSGNGINGKIASDAASVGLTLNGSYFHWSTRCPACKPVQDGRVVQVPDDDRLDIPDPSVPYTLEFRFRTTHPYGNYMQKGQSASRGGQIKVQGPKGSVQCLFKGANGTRVGTGSGKDHGLDDGDWHVVKCVHTATQVVEYVDGKKVATNNGSTGPINNSKPFTVGGKINCDQVETTCDYFSGDIDWIKVTHG
jgi:Concanavalin A-like lectin/glucanases superfamily